MNHGAATARPASAAALTDALKALFPAFADELEDGEAASYHQVVRLLAPLLAGYLATAPQKTVARFCGIVNAMADAGGEQENAIVTCLLEHASRLKVKDIVRPHLHAAARRALR